MLLAAYFLILAAAFGAKKRSPALMLSVIYLVSLLCGLPLGNQYELSSIVDWINLVFVALILTLFIAPWRSFRYSAALAEPNERRVRRLTRALLAIHAVGFVVFSMIFYFAVTSITDYSAFKNGDDGITFLRDLPINHTLFLTVTYLNWSAVFLVPLHFYHLLKKRYLLSLLCLLLSFNIALQGLAIFSRASLVVYVVLYALYLPFFYGRFDRSQRRLLSGVGFAALALFGTVFYVITNNRFSGYLEWGDAAYSTSSVQNPLLYSILDYASQWYKNGGDVLSRYSFQTLNGELTFPVLTTFGNKFGVINQAPDAIPMKLEMLWGDRYDKFVGVVPNLVFDLGYSGTVLFALFYAAIVFRIRPSRGTMSVGTLLVVGPLLILPAMGGQNSVMKLDGYNMLLLYSVVVYAYLYSRRLAAPSTTSYPPTEEHDSRT